MRVTKSLLSGISALALAGAAFAGQDSAAVYGSVTSPPENLSEQYVEPMGSEGEELLSLREEEELMLEEERLAALEEREDVIYLYPMES
jgi:hypothetical protein